MKKITRITLLAGFALGQALGLQGADPVESDYYQIDQIPIPDGVVLETSGIEMLPNGKLAVCGVTKDFTYGANVPCTSVLVDKDFLQKHSANTLRQFIGRVARTGLAPFGVAQFEDDTFLPKMCGKQENLEALSMEATAKAIIFPDEGK